MKDKIFSYSATSIGHNHIKANKICEDASDFYSDEKMHICVVADGHGSSDYPRTDRGSRYAVDAAIKCIVEFVNNAPVDEVLLDEEKNYPMLRQLSKSILNIWHQAIYNDYLSHPFTEEELVNVKERYRERYISSDESRRRIEKAYGTTLIVFVITEGYSFGLQIGDGKCVVIDQNGKFTEPIPEDENCQMNVTTSICDGDAIEEFRYYITDTIPAAVFCGTDGIEDSYASCEELYALYRSILNIYIEHGIDIGKAEVEGYLPVLSKRGSGDDVSIASIIDMEALEAIRKILSVEDEIFELQRQLIEIKERFASSESRILVLQKNIEKAIKNGRIISEQAEQYDTAIRDKNSFGENIHDIEVKLQEKLSFIEELKLEREMASFDPPKTNEDDDYYLDDVEADNTTEIPKITSLADGARLVETVIEQDDNNYTEDTSVKEENSSTVSINNTSGDNK